MSEKRHQPTAKKLSESRRKGELARSRLFTSGLAMVGGFSGLALGLPGTWHTLERWTTLLLSGGARSPGGALHQGLGLAARAVGPVALGCFVGALGAALVQAGFSFQPALVAPKLERIDPFGGLRRIFRAQAFVELGKGLVVTVLLGGVIALGAFDRVRALFGLVDRGGAMAITGAVVLVRPLLWRGLLLLLVLGVLDFLWARWRHRRSLMMTREEVQREHKDSEGDAHIKSRRRSAHRQLAQGGPARGIQSATAVVVNPTHLAVALRYLPGECEAPYLVAKAREDEALALRQEAFRLGIPVVKDIPLARSLIHYDVGEEIPEELYRAAAVVLKVAAQSPPGPRVIAR